MVRLGLTSRAQLAAENLFLRKQLALYRERRTRPRRADASTRVALVLLSQFLDWRALLTVVKPETLIRWHRQGWRLFWRWKSRPGRPIIPVDLQRLIVAMARANPTWGEERLANELRLKLGLTVSPRTIGRYLRHLRPPRGRRSAQRWATFVRNHAHAVLACDFFISVTGRFRILYVFVVLEVGTRRIAHWNVTAHPTAEWTIQQFRTAITGEAAHRFLIHDRDAIYAPAVDRAVASMGLRVLKTPMRTPQANAFCERLIGTIRRECRLADPAQRTPPQTNPSRVGHALQPGPAACQLRSRIPRGISRTELAGCPGPSLPCAMPSGRDAHSQWTASRVSLGARGRVMAASILRSTTYRPRFTRGMSISISPSSGGLT
jgi:putative transposase